MTSFAFVAHAATDVIDAVAHGQNTGDGPIASLVAGVGGAGGGLVTTADYYAIRVDADHLKLADSNAHALAGTAIDITADITGYLGVGLPWRRPRTYAALQQVKSADLNALFDAIANARQGFDSVVYPGGFFGGGAGATADDGRRLLFSGAAVVYAPLLLPVGKRILTTEWSYLVGAAGSVSTRIIRGLADTSAGLENLIPTVGADTDATNAAAQEWNVITYGHVVAAGYEYFLRFGCSSNVSQLYGCRVWTDR